MSLAWSIAEEVHSMNCLSLIATHYLELAELEKICPHLKSYHMGVEELDEKLIFTRELREGPASRSYGIHVARLAHLPEEILVRATQKLNQLERRKAPSLPLFEWSRHEST
jgi:DNA mismatch repair protein MutS